MFARWQYARRDVYVLSDFRRTAWPLPAKAGDTTAARADLERLLLQYPDYLFADDVRERLRQLP